MKTADLQTKETDLAADLQTRDCAVCNHVIRAARDFFARWQYALTSDEQAQSDFAGELGFCPRHMWQLHSMSSPWGESIGLALLTEKISGELAAVAKPPLLEDEPCLVCAMVAEAEANYIKRLAIFVSNQAGQHAYERSQGVCLPHLSRLLAIASKADGEFLLTIASRRFREMAEQMRSYAAKREAVRRDLITQDEEDAYLRALVHFVGAKEYSGP